MPEDSEKDDKEEEELDEELEGLKAELEKERARHGLVKPQPPKTIPAAPQAPSAQPEKKPDKSLDELKAELQRSAEKKTPPAVSDAESEKPTIPADDEEIDKLKSQLRVEGMRTSLADARTPTDKKSPTPQVDSDVEFNKLKAELEDTRHKFRTESTPPTLEEEKNKPPLAATAKPAQTEADESKPEKHGIIHTARITPTKTITATPEPEEKKQIPFFGKPKVEEETPQTKKAFQPFLEPLDDADTTGDATEPKPEGKTKNPQPKTDGPPTKIILMILLLIAVAAGAYMLIINQPETEIKIQCWDGSIVTDTSLCPVITTTTETTASTTTSTTSTTTTTTTIISAPVTCSDNKMCENPIPYFPYCDGKIIKNNNLKFLCIHPGAPDSYCKSLVTDPKIVKVCESDEYCYVGECYPEHCRNHIRDYVDGEEKVDCGGDCRLCNTTDTLCNNNKDCGLDTCGAPYCNPQLNPQNNCTRYTCKNPGTAQAKCTIKNTVEVLEICGRGRTCVEGQDNCMPGYGQNNCHDCIQDQGEQGIDCGGPCKACATKPYTYDTLNLTATDTIEYQGYQLKLNNLLREISCSTGAAIQVTDPYAKTVNKKVTFYDNANYFDITFGMLNADNSTIRIWITKENRL